MYYIFLLLNLLIFGSCWLSVTHGMIWGFVGPALAIIFVSFLPRITNYFILDE